MLSLFHSVLSLFLVFPILFYHVYSFFFLSLHLSPFRCRQRLKEHFEYCKKTSRRACGDFIYDSKGASDMFDQSSGSGSGSGSGLSRLVSPLLMTLGFVSACMAPMALGVAGASEETQSFKIKDSLARLMTSGKGSLKRL